MLSSAECDSSSQWEHDSFNIFIGYFGILSEFNDESPCVSNEYEDSKYIFFLLILFECIVIRFQGARLGYDTENSIGNRSIALLCA